METEKREKEKKGRGEKGREAAAAFPEERQTDGGGAVEVAVDLLVWGGKKGELGVGRVCLLRGRVPR